MIWMLWTVVALSVVYGDKETCKVQCDLNYNRNTLDSVPDLVQVCYRGCDMYVVAFISTSFNPSTINLTLPNRHMSTTHQQSNNDLETNYISLVKKKQISKTTAEPILQPVQDHPVKAGGQTTTKIPSDDKAILYQHKSTNSIGATEDTPSKEMNADSENMEKIIQMKKEDVKRTCRHACITAYGEVSQVEACVVGCHFQSKVNHTQKLLMNGGKSFMSSLRTIQSSVMNLVGHIGHFVRVSWSWTFPKTKGVETKKIQEYGTQNGIEYPAAPSIFSGLNLKQVSPREQKQGITMMSAKEAMHILEGFENDFSLEPEIFRNIDAQEHMREFANKHNIIIVKSERRFKTHAEDKHKYRKKKHHEVTETYHPKFHRTVGTNNQQHNEARNTNEFKQPPWIKAPEIRQSLDILECISRKSGLPRWFIALTMFSSIPVALWLCFSLTAPPDETKISKTKVVDAENTLDSDDNTNEKSHLIEDYDCVKHRLEIV